MAAAFALAHAINHALDGKPWLLSFAVLLLMLSATAAASNPK